MKNLILICLLILPSYVMAQDVAANKAKPEVKAEDKKVPETFSIPDARKDKVKLLQQDVELAALRMKEIERLYKEQEAFQKSAMDKWQIELMSAMKLAGVEDKDYGLYEYNRETMTFTKKKVDAPAKTP